MRNKHAVNVMNKDFLKQFRETLRVFDQELFLQNHASCCNGISMAQCHTLLEIEKNEEISVSDLARNLSLDKSTVSRTVDGLVNIKMVNRVIPDQNRRLALINLTDSGKQVCSAINYSSDSYVSDMLKDFTDDEKQLFLKLFAKITANMSAYREKEKKLP